MHKIFSQLKGFHLCNFYYGKGDIDHLCDGFGDGIYDEYGTIFGDGYCLGSNYNIGDGFFRNETLGDGCIRVLTIEEANA